MSELESTNEKQLTVIPDRESISAVSDFFDLCVEEFEIPMKVGFRLKVVVDEIFSNIVHYSGARQAQVCFRNDPETVTLVFLDDGTAYNPLLTEEPDVTAAAEDRQIGGLGLLMVKKMAQDLRYDYLEGKNRMTVVLSKKIPQKKMVLEDF